MGKIQKKLQARQLANTKHQEGLIRVSFSFDGKVYMREHRMNPQEVQAAKDMLEEHGPDAFDSATIRAPIKGCSMFGEYVATEAFKEYARSTWVKPAPPPEPKPNVFTLSAPELPTAHEVAKQLVANHEARNKVDNAVTEDAVVLSDRQVKAVDDTAGLEPL